MKFFLASSAHQLSASSYGVGSALPLLCGPILSPCLTRRSSRPAYSGRLTLHVSPAEIPIYAGRHLFQRSAFLKGFSFGVLALRWASPAYAAPVSSLFGLQRMHSQRHQLSFLQRCAASVAQRFFVGRTYLQVRARLFGHRV